MGPIGFSTGALALGDFAAALDVLRGQAGMAVELSALRLPEVAPLLGAVRGGLDVSAFAYVSVHAPSRYPPEAEAGLAAELLALVQDRGWPVIVHPDAIADFSRWRPLGRHLLVENMDLRKPAGKTAAELAAVFAHLPEAGWCLDLGHAWQVDPTLGEARAMLARFSGRLRQLHLSEVSPLGKHHPLSDAAVRAFQQLGAAVDHVPLILETPVRAADVPGAVARARAALRGAAGS